MSPTKALIKNASLLMSGTIVAQFITFGLSFVLTRMYLPDAFGRYTIFMGVAGVLAAAATGAFDRVIVLAKTLQEARQAATLTMVTSVSVALIIVLMISVLILTGESSIMPIPIIDAAIFLPAFILCYAGAQVFIYSSLREDRVQFLSVIKVVQSAVMGIVQLSTAGISAISGLIMGNVSGLFILAVVGAHWRWKIGSFRRDLKVNSLLTAARANIRFPQYIMPNELIDNLSNQVPILLIGTFFTLSDAGHYGLAIMMLSAPSALVGRAMGQAFLQYLGSHGDDTLQLRQLMYRVWGVMAMVSIMPFAAILIAGDAIFSIAFGSQWELSGTVAQALSILLFVKFVSSPTSTVYLKLGMQKEQWRFCLAAAFYRTAAYSLAALNYGLMSIIWVHVVLEVLFIILYNLVALRRLKSISRQAGVD